MKTKANPKWTDIVAAYEEAAEHLEICAGQMQTEEEKDDRAAHFLVAARIRAAGNRIKPNPPTPPT